MTLILTATFTFLAGLGIGLIAAFGVNYALTLRRQLRAAQTARLSDAEKAEWWRTASESERAAVWARERLRPVVADFNDRHPEKEDAPRFSGIGPSDIASRELYEREKAKSDKTPKFASPGVLNPDLSDIREAAREATNGRAN